MIGLLTAAASGGSGLIGAIGSLFGSSKPDPASQAFMQQLEATKGELLSDPTTTIDEIKAYNLVISNNWEPMVQAKYKFGMPDPDYYQIKDKLGYVIEKNYVPKAGFSMADVAGFKGTSAKAMFAGTGTSTGIFSNPIVMYIGIGLAAIVALWFIFKRKRGRR